uniref:Type I inositol 1,4,5-trisphosphate 5-phosphatase 1 n=2 Tax=Anthurium amnicola TaxID=1678845 RepID=A0A1D1XET1_9ARAE
MKQRSSRRGGELFWPKIVLRKWLNISTRDSDFSADESEAESQFEDEEMCGWERDLQDDASRMGGRRAGINENFPTMRRRKSETLRAQYINIKELRICVGTWNVGGKLPPDDLDIKEWLNMEEPADIYVLGLQEIVPLNAGNIFGAEDGRPVPRWESIIRETLNRSQTVKAKVKCYSDPPSPSRFLLSDDLSAFVDEIFPGSDSDTNEEEVHPLDDLSFHNLDAATAIRDENECSQDTSFCGNSDVELLRELDKQKKPSPKRLNRLQCFSVTDDEVHLETSVIQPRKNLSRTLSSSERISLSWPEQPLNLVPQSVLGNFNSLKSVSSFRTCNTFKMAKGESAAIGFNFGLDLDSVKSKRKRSAFVRIISKQMVGIYLSIWVRRSLRKHIQNLKVSTVGVGVMGYIGNKGSISVSMSIYQTLFCFVCCHLTSGEKEGDELRRNADVQEIHRRTIFNLVPSINVPRAIQDHERIIWLGDLNYRIKLPYEKTRALISRKEWSKLVEMDQLKRELKKGRAFDGWSEGVLNFPPTYKYEPNSEDYFGEDPKLGRRTPAWCDRILSFGKGMRLLKYNRSELKLSDHRPVTAIFVAEVEVFSHRRLQRALTFTDAEIEECEII